MLVLPGVAAGVLVEDEAGADDDSFVEDVEVESDLVSDLESPAGVDLAPSSFLEGLADEYASAYQPPPLRMKLPPLICRWALFFWHLGHCSMAGSVIFWISSQWFPHVAHTYS